LNRLHDLTLELLRVTEEHQEVIPRLPTLPRLRSLSLRAWNAGALTAWFHWPGLAQVERLQLQFAERDLETVQGLLASPYRRSLTHLCLNSNRTYPDQTGSLEAIEAAYEPFREVHSLEIHGFRIGFLLSLLRRFPRLEELDLSQSRISRSDLGSVLELLPTETLRCLKLSGLYLRDDALPLLTGSPALDQVECLEILHTGHFSSESWQAVRDHFGSRLSFRGSP
jgi:hypothetical protein